MSEKYWSSFSALPATSILKTIEIIDKSQAQFAIITDESGILHGVVTDGDIRRAILKGISLDQPVSKVMNPNPVTVKIGTSRQSILDAMKAKHLRHIPVVDEANRIVTVEILDNLLASNAQENVVVLMAGGLGSRLRPLTDHCPKPLLPVGERPILETTIKNFSEFGFRNFMISVNYKAEMIKDHFKDGKSLGVDITYVEENEFLGTAGALSLLPERPKRPFFVMNGDLLTNVNFQHLLRFHEDHKAAATMCVRQYDFQVPYGVVGLENEKILSIDEKPFHKFFVNGGIYVLEPNILDMIPPETPMDMPTLFQKCIQQKLPAIAFPIREYWLDIGQISDFERAQGDFTGLFGKPL